MLTRISVKSNFHYKANAVTFAVPVFIFFYLRNTFLHQHLIQLSILAIAFLLALWISRLKIDAVDAPSRILMNFFLSFSIVLFLQSLWTYTFILNYLVSGYRGDIFRKAILRPHSPVYGESELLPIMIIIGALAIMLIGVNVLLKTVSHPYFIRRYKIIYGVIFIIFATTFALSESEERLLTYYAQQYSFYADVKLFDGPPDLLKNYIANMPLLTNRGQHYPPGNLLVLSIGSQIGFIFGLKALCYLSPLIGFFYLNKLLSVLGFSKEESRFSLFLFLFGYGTIAFISLSTTPILLALFIGACYAVLNNNGVIHRFYPAITGFILSVSFLFSFSTVVMIAFLFMADLFVRIHYKQKMLLVERWLIIGLVVGIFYLFLFLFFGFNMYECFTISVENNRNLMTANPFDDAARYFLRSSGNLIAFFILPNITAAILAAWSIKELRHTRNELMRSYAQSFFLTVLIFSFSGLYFLETERIWLFLTPSFAILASFWLKTLPLAYKDRIEQTMMVITILISFAIELSFRPFL